MVKEKDLLQKKIIPVYSDANAAGNQKIITACYKAGLRYFEFTNRHENALEEFDALKKYCDNGLRGMILGAGTIKNIADAEMFLSAGAAFLVSPLISMEMVEFMKKKQLLWIPGCATASEIGLAENAGLKLVKIFPAKQLGGAPFIKAMKGPYPAMQMIVTGGIRANDKEIKKYFESGAEAVGLGSAFFNPKLSEKEIIKAIKNLLTKIS